MGGWQLPAEKLKHYPHFDRMIGAHAASVYASDPDKVASHKFWPFLRYINAWNKFALPSLKGKRKERPIRYAARLDAYIFTRYRDILAQKYEAVLTQKALGNAVLAYRKILIPGSRRSKSNIEHALDVFKEVRSLGNCCVLTFDISSFFENIDHARLKKTWCDLIGVSRLPDDHMAVFRAITQYSFVEKQEAYERLGLFGPKPKKGASIKGYLVPYKDTPRQLSTGNIFRLKIAGKDGSKSAIKKNHKPYGVPQGAPISDLLANIYLLEFDASMSEKISDAGGIYRRYSDDIVVVLPLDLPKNLAWADYIRAEITQHGAHLKIKQSKCSVHVFTRQANGHQACALIEGTQGRNGLEYLGFRFDGRSVFLRDSTVSNLLRKIQAAAEAEARKVCDKYPAKTLPQLLERVNIEEFVKRFGRVEDFEARYRAAKSKGIRTSERKKLLTFWSYVRRAHTAFAPFGSGILGQVAKHPDSAARRLRVAVARRYQYLQRQEP